MKVNTNCNFRGPLFSRLKWHVVIKNNAQNQKSKGNMQTRGWPNTDLLKNRGRLEEWVSSAYRSHPLFVLFVVIGKREKIVDDLVRNYGLSIRIKNVSQHATEWQVLFVNKVVVSTIEFTIIWHHSRLLLVLFYQPDCMP